MADEYIDKVEVGAKIQMMYIRREMDYGGENDFCRGMRKALRVIENMPAADVKPVKRGHWKDIMMSEATGWDLSLTGGRDAVLETVCSVCGDCCAFGGDGEDYLSPYCPNCGARMDGEHE